MKTESDSDSSADPTPDQSFIEGEDYYLDEGLLVFTAAFLLKQGVCCNSGCRHCPYPPKAAAGSSANE